MFRELRAFLSAVARDWVAQMSGAASLGLWVWGYFKRDPNLADRALWPLAGLCLFVTFYRVWRAEHRALEDAKSSSEPKFKALVRRTVLVDGKDSSGRGVAIVFITAEVKNLGADSIVEGWSVTAIVDGRHTLAGLNVPSTDYKLAIDSTSVTFFAADDVTVRTATEPVKRGAKITGSLMAIFPGVSRHAVDADTIVVSFRDAWGRNYTVDPGVPEEIPDKAVLERYYPGLTRPRN